MGVMSGTLDLLQRSYAGTHIRDRMLYFDPQLPRELDELSFSMRFEGTPLQVTLSRVRLTVAAHPEGASRPIRVAIGEDIRELCPGDRHTFELRRASSAELQQARG
jgi:trehalose/maltose hydrolase-like predicted phosphorylase